MNNDLENIEEDLKKKEQKKKFHKESGRSVFELQKIIKEKSKGSKEGHANTGESVDGNS